MLNFYPGPSKIHSQVQQWTNEAFESGILERNHRSDPFMSLLKETISNFKIAQGIPEEFAVVFTSSATECWEIVNQSLLYGRVQFAYNGAFGKKWFKYAVTNNTPAISEIRGSRFEMNETLSQVDLDPANDCLCLVQSETSNGTAIQKENLAGISQNTLKIMDATSSIGGVMLDWDKADVWFCSTQKCLGLPSGMGIMVLSQKAIQKTKELNEKKHYNSLITILENFEKFQTHYTPNILLIYLLNEVSKKYCSIESIAKKIKDKSKLLYDFISQHNHLQALISTEEARSQTIIAVSAKENIIQQIHQEARKNRIILGQGYGEWRNTSFRIANFPAHTEDELHQLKAFLGSL